MFSIENSLLWINIMLFALIVWIIICAAFINEGIKILRIIALKLTKIEGKITDVR